MKNLEKVGDVYIKRSKFWGDRIIYPIQKDLNKKLSLDNINYFNLLVGGAWGKLVITIIIVLLVLGMSLSYYIDVKYCKDIVSNPDEFCIGVEKERVSDWFLDVDTNIGEVKDGRDT